MKSLFFGVLTAISGLFLAGCSNELDINDDWKETPVAYALLNPASPKNYIRLQRAYLGEGNAYLMGQYSDSLYFDTNQVSVRVVRIGNNSNNLDQVLDTLYCPVTTDVAKAEGVFSDAPHYLYEMNSRAFSDSRYRLYVNRHKPVGNLTVTSRETDIFSPSAAAQQFIVLVKAAELNQAGLTDGTVLHSLGFLAGNVQGDARYNVSVSAVAVNGGLNAGQLPNFGNPFNEEIMRFYDGWNDLFFKTTYALPAGSDIAFRICIHPVSGAGSADLAFTATPGTTTFTRSASCGDGSALSSEEKRPVLRLGYSANGVNNRISSAETNIVASFNSPTLGQINSINLANDEPFRIKCVSSKNAAVQSLDARFRYLERKNGQLNYVEKSLIFPLGEFVPSTINGGETFEYLFSGDAFFQYIASQVPNDPNVTRPATAVKIDFIARLGNLDFYTYYVVNQPGNSVYSQPEFTNIENGKGIFSCRLDSLKQNYTLNNASTDSLNYGRYTGNLFN